MASSCPECGSLYIPTAETIPATTKTLAQWQRLVKSNDAPGSAELAFIRSVVSDTGARLDFLDSEISRLRDRLEQLQAERAQLSEYHSQNVSILSPLRRMPPEVLVQIFLRTLPPFDDSNGDASDARGSPWTLAQVSGRWREIALSTPSLWSTLRVFAHDPDSEHSDMLQAQLRRSGMRNLDIQFFGYENDNTTEQVKLFDLLSEHSARWETLYIQLSSALVPRLAQLRGRLPSLQRLWLQWDSEQSQLGVDSITCFRTAPSLFDAGVANKAHFIPVLVPAHQLTTYRLHGPWKMHLHVLKLAPNIVSARIITAFDGEEPWPEPGPQTIDLVHLQRLYVSDQRILDYLRAPHLAELAVRLSVTDGESILVNSLDALFVRSACAPQKLYLKGISSVITLGILKKHPFITAITLAFLAGGTDAMEAHMTMLADVSEYQHLREISFGAFDSMPIDYPLFLRMLKSRLRSSLRAASFFAIEGPDPDPVTLAGLDELRDGGLDLRVESGPEAQTGINVWENVCLWNE
ncbi:hypothetical protein FB45DRAFT_1067140 [Roridomyces roridus]|uniref:F-box domain-containing protein n=1 Tax=Roridomyces roridus TaxID=1738132 RepID=A0AAD7FAM7_9AGAR|nr:hypothetical protein FB45DRAFT_1067140 [Roridomyces roridus]